MAHSIPCKHCGWQETEHLDASFLSEKEIKTRKRGFRLSLQQCGGVADYQPKNKKDEVREHDAECGNGFVGATSLPDSIATRIETTRRTSKMKKAPSSYGERQGMDDFEMILCLLGHNPSRKRRT